MRIPNVYSQRGFRFLWRVVTAAKVKIIGKGDTIFGIELGFQEVEILISKSTTCGMI